MIHSLLRQFLSWKRAETPRLRAYQARLFLHANPSELGPDVTVEVAFGRIDATGEILLASGGRFGSEQVWWFDEELGWKRVVGRMLTAQLCGPNVALGIRFDRTSEYFAALKAFFKENTAFVVEFGFLSFESSPTTREERKVLGLSWLTRSPRVHRKWELVHLCLVPDPISPCACQVNRAKPLKERAWKSSNR